MERKYLFNDVAIEYDKIRPSYPKQLFDDIVKYSNVNKSDQLLEVGCGTGLATQGFVNLGYQNITCIELGQNLAEFTKNKFKHLSEIYVHNTSFENWDNKDNLYELIYSATAFHFIAPAIGYPKLFNLLKPGGVIALFWTVHVKDNDTIHNEIRNIYKEFAPHLDDSLIPSPDNFISETQNIVRNTGLFKELDVKIYKGLFKYSAKEYISLLNTHSKHRQLDASNKTLLFDHIEEVIDNFGGVIHKTQMYALFLGKK